MNSRANFTFFDYIMSIFKLEFVKVYLYNEIAKKNAFYLENHLPKND